MDNFANGMYIFSIKHASMKHEVYVNQNMFDVSKMKETCLYFTTLHKLVPIFRQLISNEH